MSAHWRAGLVLIVLLALGGLLTAGRWLPETTTDSALAPADAMRVSVMNCRECHAAVWQEWETSFHSRAFTDPNVQAAFRHFGHDRQCESCHASQPILHDLAAPVALRAESRDTGVDCLVCHQLPDGSMAARHTVPTAPCRPVATAALTQSLHCGRCHTAIHKDSQEGTLASSDKNCQSCHMPAVASRPGGRSHLCLGGHDEATVKSGVTLATRREGDKIFVTVANPTTGHNFPGERHNRVLLVQIIERTKDDEVTLAQQRTIKAMTPFRGETSTEQIRAGESFVAEFPVVAPAVKAEIKLLYKLFPYLSDREAQVVHQVELVLP